MIANEQNVCALSRLYVSGREQSGGRHGVLHGGGPVPHAGVDHHPGRLLPDRHGGRLYPVRHGLRSPGDERALGGGQQERLPLRGLYLFKKAKVYVSDEEFTQVAKLWALGVQKPAYDRWDMGAYFGAGLDWRLVERDEQELPIAPGVTILNLGSGHTYGLMALYVELKNTGNVLLVSDAIHTRENAGPPVRSPGMVYDSLGYAATVKRIFRFAEAHEAGGRDDPRPRRLLRLTDSRSLFTPARAA